MFQKIKQLVILGSIEGILLPSGFLPLDINLFNVFDAFP